MKLKEVFRKKRVKLIAIGTGICILGTGIGINFNKKTNCDYAIEKDVEENHEKKHIHNYIVKQEQNEIIDEMTHKVTEIYECTDCGKIRERIFDESHVYELQDMQYSSNENGTHDVIAIFECEKCDYMLKKIFVDEHDIDDVLENFVFGNLLSNEDEKTKSLVKTR